MIDMLRVEKSKLFQELDEEQRTYWFDMRTKKFLHNIDTFYYSVKLQEDFTRESRDKSVLAFRAAFEKEKKKMDIKGFSGDVQQYFVPEMNDYLNIYPRTFHQWYNICLEAPEQFDIFWAPVVPGNENGISVTSEIIVQIRANMLWQYGVTLAFEKSYKWVQALCKMFDFNIIEVKENRTDFCWHTNYFANPEKFFTPESFYKMSVTTLDRKGVNFHTAPVGKEDYEVDYVGLGNRGDKVFLRMYLKSKEVIQQGYKPFFFKTWLFHGLINRYDFEIYERCYLEKSWSYRTIARLMFYLQYGSDETYKYMCRQFIAQYNTYRKVTDGMMELADYLTPPITLIMNIEFQVMRKSSKSYKVLPIKDNSAAGPAQRIYDFLDNRRLITDYLTSKCFRFAEKTGDSNKSRRPDCGFWNALRRTKMVDAPPVPEELKMTRIYTRKLDAKRIKKSLINKAVTYGIYLKGKNDDSIVSDLMLSLCRMNDNDLNEARQNKMRKLKLMSDQELEDAMPDDVWDSQYEFDVIERNSGVLFEDIVDLEEEFYNIEESEG